MLELTDHKSCFVHGIFGIRLTFSPEDPFAGNRFCVRRDLVVSGNKGKSAVLTLLLPLSSHCRQPQMPILLSCIMECIWVSILVKAVKPLGGKAGRNLSPIDHVGGLVK